MSEGAVIRDALRIYFDRVDLDASDSIAEIESRHVTLAERAA